jgi:hypothetical protein
MDTLLIHEFSDNSSLGERSRSNPAYSAALDSTDESMCLTSPKSHNKDTDDSDSYYKDDYANDDDDDETMSSSSHPIVDRQFLINSCMEMIMEKVKLNSKRYTGDIFLDCDAFSFIISVDCSDHKSSMDSSHELIIKDFLYLFGTATSDTEIPIKQYASKRKDSMFGTNHNYCQHLHSTTCHDVLTTNEVLVIMSPVKIAVQSQCKEKILHHLSSHPPKYYFEPSTNANICIQPNEAPNVPSYGRMIDAILNSCYVPTLNKFVLHVASFGKRHTMDTTGHDPCNVQRMFDIVQQMRKVNGITVELVQIDIAFSLETKDELVLWSNKKIKNIKKRQKPYMLRGALLRTYCLHSIVNNNEQIAPDNNQDGSIQLKHDKNWNQSEVSLVPEHYEIENMEDKDCVDGEKEYHKHWCEPMARCYSQTKICHTTLHNIKAYSTISHMITKGRKDQPLSVKKMDILHTWSFRQLQKFVAHMRKTAQRITKNVKKYGISARFEFSIRPNNCEVARVLRYCGDLSDVLLHVHVGLHDVLCNNHRKLCIRLIPLEPVRAKTDYLLEHLSSQLQIRASESFCNLYKDCKVHAWLKAIANLIMVTVGIAPEYNLKYVRRWMKDCKRHDPFKEAPLILTSFLQISPDVTVATPTVGPVIPNDLVTITESVLDKIGISTDGIAKIAHYLTGRDAKLNSSMYLNCFQSLSLPDKLVFVENSHEDIMPEFLTQVAALNKDDTISIQLPPSSPPSLPDNEYAEIHDRPMHSLNDSHKFLESALKLSQGINHQHQRIYSTHQTLSQDPINFVLHRLNSLAQFGDQSQPVFTQRLYLHIIWCHNNQVCLQEEKPLLPFVHTNEIVLNKYLQVASSLLSSNSSDLSSLKKICNGLGISSYRLKSRMSLISKLCAQYYFPCSHPHDEDAIQKSLPQSESTVYQLNQSINDACGKSFVIPLPHQNPTKQNQFYRSTEDIYIYIRPKDTFMIEEYLAYDVDYEDEDMYVVLDFCFVPYITADGYECRTRLHTHLQTMTFLSDSFLLDNAENNPHFSNALNVEELQRTKHFALDPHNSSLADYLNMCPEIIFPVTAHMYQTSICFIDYNNSVQFLHLYNESLNKVVTYTYEGRNFFPTISCKVFARFEESYQHIVIDPTHIKHTQHYQSLVTPFTNTFEGGTVYTHYKNHPQGPYKQNRSGRIVTSILGCLTSSRIKHQHFTELQVTHQKDPLDLFHYLNELCTFYRTTPLLRIFDNTILSSWVQNKSMKLRQCSTFGDFLMQFLSIPWQSLEYDLVFPLMCLKYKLWLCCWVQETDNKLSYFYAYDPTTAKVILKVHPSFVFKEEESHILYFKHSKTSSGKITTGYWPGELHNPFTSLNTTYTPGMIVATEYSYLDGYLLSVIFKKLENAIGLHLISKDGLCHPIAPVDRTSPTIYLHAVHDQNDLLLDHFLMVYYPFCETNRKYPILWIHGLSTELIRQEVTHLHANIAPDVLDHYICTSFDSHPKLDFASIIPMMVFIYIAHFTTSPDMMVSILYDLHAETDLVKKAKDWLSHIASNFCLVTQPPSWLSLLCLRHNCKISDNAPITSPSQEIQRYIKNQRQPSISTSTRNHVIPDQLQCPIATHVGTSKNSTRNGMTIRRTRSGAAIRGNSTTNIHNESFPGIRNIGNSCYLAATLHLIFGCNQWVAAVNRVHHRLSLSSGVRPRMMPIMQSLVEIAYHLSVLNNHDSRNDIPDFCSTAANPSKFKNSCQFKFHG